MVLLPGGAPGACVTAACALRGGSRLAFGGDSRDVVVLDTATGAVVARARPPPADWLGLQSRVTVASLAFVSASPHTLLCGGSGSVRLFDFRAQRRAVRSFALPQGLAQALAPTSDGATAYAGTSRGALLALDVATGRVGGALRGATAALRSAQLHPALPLLAVTGLDRFVRLYSTATRAQLGATFLKLPAVALAWDPTPQQPAEAAHQGEKEEAQGGPAAGAPGRAAAQPGRVKRKRRPAALELNTD